MGTNRRYAASIDAQMDRRIIERTIAGVQPATLTPAELELDLEPVTRPPVPRPVTAWVRYGATALSVPAVAVAWTARAVAIKWEAPDGAEHHAWVWASAVRPR